MSDYRNTLIVAFDFDGTITDGSGGLHGPFTMRPDTADLLRFLKAEGIHLILWTCREDEVLHDAQLFLAQHSLWHLFSAINDNVTFLSFPTSRKIYADYYVDDRDFGWAWDKDSRWLPLVQALEKDSFFNRKGYQHPGFLCRSYLEFLIK